MKKVKDCLDFFERHDIFVSPDILDNDINEYILDDNFISKNDILVLDLEELSRLNKIVSGLKKEVLEYSKKESKDVFDGMSSSESVFDDDFEDVEIIHSYSRKPKRFESKDFIKYWNNRYKGLESMLKSRPSLKGLTSISKMKNNVESRCSFIGMVVDKSETKNGHYILTVEDRSDVVKVLVSVKNKELHDFVKDLTLDEVVGFIGSYLKGEDDSKFGSKGNGGIFFVNDIVYPDVANKVFKKHPEEFYGVFISDLHFGAKLFLEKELKTLFYWIAGKVGNDEQRAKAKKIRYVVIAGDIVEGVGIYPNQDKDLSILDVYEQYELFKKYLKILPKSVKVIISPGNHDVGRISEPQFAIDFDDKIKDMFSEFDNLYFVSNPATVLIGKTRVFPGFEVLIYHGGSLIYYSDVVPSIRAAGGQKRVDLIMKFLLQRRHLAPTHASVGLVPDDIKDPLLIKSVPDFFVTGHIHRASVSTYKNVTLMNTSAWSATSDEQIKRGLEPQPGKAIIVNFQTREVSVMSFYNDPKEEALRKLEEEKVRKKKEDEMLKKQLEENDVVD